MTQEVEGCRWDATLISETWRAINAEFWETQQGHIHGSWKIREQARSWSSGEQGGENVSIGQTTSANAPYQRRSQSTNNMYC